MLFSLEFAFFVPPRGLPSELFALGPIFFFLRWARLHSSV